MAATGEQLKDGIPCNITDCRLVQFWNSTFAGTPIPKRRIADHTSFKNLVDYSTVFTISNAIEKSSQFLSIQKRLFSSL